MELFIGNYPGINFSGLDAEFRNNPAVPLGYDGMTYGHKTGELTLFFDGADSEAVQVALPLLQSIVENHDPNNLTPAQISAQKAVAALAELGASDYAAWEAGVQGITTLAQAKTRLSQLGRVVFLLLQAQGINEIPE